jgi:hypothetical protein
MAFCRWFGSCIDDRPQRKRALGGFLRLALACGVAAGALGGCGLSGGVGVLMVDPARYAAYRCKDLVAERKALTKRKQDLRDLIDKAGGGVAGTLVGTIAYRGDYDTVLQQEKLLKQTAAQQKCQLTPAYGSDQTIH